MGQGPASTTVARFLARACACVCACCSVARADDLPPEPEPSTVVAGEEVPGEPEAPAHAPEPADVAPPLPPTLTRGGDAGDWTVRAGRLSWDPQRRVMVADDGVVVSTPQRVISAPRVELDFAGGQVVATGPVLVAEERHVARCSSARLDMKDGRGTLGTVVLDVRTPMDAATREQAVRLGAVLTGSRVARVTGNTVEVTGQGRVRVRDARVTTCECSDEESAPPIAVTARQADVRAGEFATAWWPTLELYGFPVAVAPFWVIPLKPRFPGLLFPQLRLQDGLWVQQPLYVVLGDSADVTVAPGMVTQRGPRLSIEARAAPQDEGWMEVQGVYQRDARHLQVHRDPARSAPAEEGAVPWRDTLGLRTSRTSTGEWLSPDRFSFRGVARARAWKAALGTDINLVSDRFVPGDFGNSLGERVAPYLRSGVAAGLGHHHGHFVAAVQMFQDLQQPGVSFWGPANARLAHRIPLLQWRLLELPLLPAVEGLGSPLVARGLASLDHEWLVGSGRTREDFGRDGRWAGALRAVVQPELAVPVRFSRFGGARFTLGARETVLVGRGGEVADVTRVYARSRVESEVTGRWRVAGWSLMHRVRPHVGTDGVVLHRASGHTPHWMDAADRVRPFHAAGAGVDQWAEARAPGGRIWTVAADVRAAADMLDVRRGEVRADVRAATPGASVLARAAVDPWAREVTFAQLGTDVGSSTGPQVHLGYTRIGKRSPRFMVGGADELLGGVRLDGPRNDAASDRLDGSVAVMLGHARVDYGAEVAFPGMEWTQEAAKQGTWRQAQPVVLAHGGGVTLTSACRCWQAGARMRFWPGRALPDVGVSLSLSGPDGQLDLFR